MACWTATRSRALPPQPSMAATTQAQTKSPPCLHPYSGYCNVEPNHFTADITAKDIAGARVNLGGALIGSSWEQTQQIDSVTAYGLDAGILERAGGSSPRPFVASIGLPVWRYTLKC